MFLGAHVLLPEGFDTHPNARYPLIINHGHFPQRPRRLARDAARSESEMRLQRALPPRVLQPHPAAGGLRLLQGLDGRRTSRACSSIEIQHANPYYDDSYAVNSANLGPYGDAIMKELMPAHREEDSAASARAGRAPPYGGSTGGWEALAVQMFYPDDFNGAYAACPDPIDFRAYTVVDIYKDANAYCAEGPFMKSAAARPPQLPRPRPGDARADESHASSCSAPRRAAASSGTSGKRSTRRMGPTAIPRASGTSAPASSTRRSPSTGSEHYDLSCDPAPRLGPAASARSSRARLHLYVGDMDNYYLNNAVYLVEDFLKRHEESRLRRRGRPTAIAPSTAGTAIPRAPNALLAPALSPDVHPEVRRAGAQDGAGRRRRAVVELLVLSEGLRPSDSPTRSLARRFAGALPPPLKLRRDLAEASCARRAVRVARSLCSLAPCNERQVYQTGSSLSPSSSADHFLSGVPSALSSIETFLPALVLTWPSYVVVPFC